MSALGSAHILDIPPKPEPFYFFLFLGACGENRHAVITTCLTLSLIFMCVCVSVCSQDETPSSGLKDQQVLGVWGYCKLFQHSVETLRTQLQDKGEGAELVWDKVTHKKKKDGRNIAHLLKSV